MLKFIIQHPVIVLFSFLFLFFYPAKGQKQTDLQSKIMGEWLKTGDWGMYSITFTANHKLQADFNNDSNPEMVSEYQIQHDTLFIKDVQSQGCPGTGRYLIEKNKYCLSLKMIQDNCNGRINVILGYWVRDDFRQTIQQLQQKQDSTKYKELAKIYIAISEIDTAMQYLNTYLQHDSADVQVLLDRASVLFMNGQYNKTIKDCNRVQEISPGNHRVYALRGMAYKNLGLLGAACKDLKKAVDFGYTNLQKITSQVCKE
jgi:tetratricopeptide (TPR) repeat protein